MQMISKKDLYSAEMDTLTNSCSPTIVINANGEVQTHEEATVSVKELNIFLTTKVLANTPAVLSLGKLCDENGYSDAWINGQKPHPIKKGSGFPATRRTSLLSWFQGCRSGSDSSTSMTLLRQENHSSSSSSILENENRIESDMSPVTVSTLVDERSGRPDIDHAHKKIQNQRKRNPRGNGATRCLPSQVV